MRQRDRQAVRTRAAPSHPPTTLLALSLLGRGYEARFVHTMDRSYLLTNADADLVYWLAARMGAHVDAATRVGLSRAFAVVPVQLEGATG